MLETAFTRIREETGLQTCASLGLMTKENLARLKDAGMQSMHHNLETARSYHHKIVETHSYDDEVETIKAAKSTIATPKVRRPSPVLGRFFSEWKAFAPAFAPELTSVPIGWVKGS